MQVNVGDIFKAIGPGASVIFAAWIFVGFLQVRYDAAMDRYLEMVHQYRAGDISDTRMHFLKGQILTYRRRCALMNVASATGLISAATLVLALVACELALLFPHLAAIAYASVGLAFVGLLLIVVAATIVFIEGTIIHRQLEDELRDIPDLAEEGVAEGSDVPRRKRLGLAG